MVRKKKRVTPQWCVREGLLYVLTEKGPEEVRLVAPLSNIEVWFSYLGREYKFTKIDVRAKREYYIHGTKLSEDIHRAMQAMAACLMQGIFAHWQPKWKKNGNPLTLQGESLRILSISFRHLEVLWQGKVFQFEYADGRVYFEQSDDADLMHDSLREAIEVLARQAWRVLPLPKVVVPTPTPLFGSVLPVQKKPNKKRARS